MKSPAIPPTASVPSSTPAAVNSVLLIDDQAEESKALAAVLRQRGFAVYSESDTRDTAAGRDVDVVVSKLPAGGRGIRTIRSWRRQQPGVPLIAIAGENNVDQAVDAMRMGADDCLTQPVHPDKLTASIQRVLSIRRTSPDASPAPSPASSPEVSVEGLGELVGSNSKMQKVFDQAHRVAPTNSTVLLAGGTGTGKDLLAAAIHRLSHRRDEPFVAVNVAAVPTTLIESELFGHVKGAFTDAACDRVGRFEAADGGTLFIDEIGDLQLASQAKLLRVLESRMIHRVGSNDERPVDVRVIAATSRNLEHLLCRGRFREDLYYRLNVVRIALPDLHERCDDIPLLVDHFLQQFAAETQTPVKRLDDELARFLCSYAWPGNVRQLKNCLESMVVMSTSDVLRLDDLPPTMVEAAPSAEAPRKLPLADYRLADLEREAIRQTLEHHDGHRSQAAEQLGISVRTLQRKLKRWNVSLGETNAPQ